MRYAIGGVPTSGKTTLARTLSAEMQLPHVSTDLIRSYTQKVIGKPTYFQDLPQEVELTLENYIGEQTPEQIYQREYDKNQLLATYVEKWFEADWAWNDYVLEGTGVQPSHMSSTDHPVRCCFLVYENDSLIRERIFSRGLWDEAANYSDEYKEKEVAWVSLYNKKLTEQAKSFGLDLIYADKEEVLPAAKRILLED